MSSVSVFAIKKQVFFIWGRTENIKFYLQKLCIYSHMFKPQPPSNYSPFVVVLPIVTFFFTAQNSFWTCRHWCLFVFQLFFVSPLPLWQNISFEDFFHLGKQEKDACGKIGWTRRVGPRVTPLLVKDWWTFSVVRAGALVTHPPRNALICWKSFKKNSLNLNIASHNASWSTDADGFREHAPSRRSLYYKGPGLQKIILFLGGPIICFGF